MAGRAAGRAAGPVRHTQGKSREAKDLKLRDNKQRDAGEFLLRAKGRNEICREPVLPLGTVNNCRTRICQNAGVRGLPELLPKYAEKNTEEK